MVFIIRHNFVIDVFSLVDQERPPLTVSLPEIILKPYCPDQLSGARSSLCFSVLRHEPFGYPTFLYEGVDDHVDSHLELWLVLIVQ